MGINPTITHLKLLNLQSVILRFFKCHPVCFLNNFAPGGLVTCVCLVLCVVFNTKAIFGHPKKNATKAPHIGMLNTSKSVDEPAREWRVLPMYITHYYRCQHVPTYGSFAGQYRETFLLIHQASLSLKVPSTVLISYFALHQGLRDVAVLWLNHCYGSFENASKQGKGCKGCCITGPFQLAEL